MKTVKHISLYLGCLWTCLLQAQYFDISPNFHTETYFPYYMIWDIDISTGVNPQHYYFVQCELKDDRQNVLLISRTQSFLLSANQTPYPVLYNKNENGEYEYEWIDPAFYEQVQQTGGFLPPGDYEIKYSLLSTTKGCNWAGEMQFIKTVNLSVSLFNLLDLVSPMDKDTLLNNSPVFVWLPLSPEVNGGVSYTLRLVQINEGQSPQEGINTNLPFYEESNITATTHAYPVSARMLEYGKQYAWMVTAFINGKVAAYSPVYSFYMHSGESQQPQPVATPFYIELMPQSEPQTTEWNEDDLYISYVLAENQKGTLNYKIVNNSTGKELVNQKIQPLIVGQGKNLYRIDISRLPKNKLYELIIQGVDNTDVRRWYFYLKQQ